jgi:hypothetical protein
MRGSWHVLQPVAPLSFFSASSALLHVFKSSDPVYVQRVDVRWWWSPQKDLLINSSAAAAVRADKVTKTCWASRKHASPQAKRSSGFLDAFDISVVSASKDLERARRDRFSHSIRSISSLVANQNTRLYVSLARNYCEVHHHTKLY